MQIADLDRIHARETELSSLAIERNYWREELFQCCRDLNIAEAWQVRPIVQRLEQIRKKLEEHADKVEEHYVAGSAPTKWRPLFVEGD